MLSELEAQRLLDDLCVRLGFCLPPAERSRLTQDPPRDVRAFTDAVFLAEGLDVDVADKQLHRQVQDMVAAAFERHSQGDGQPDERADDGRNMKRSTPELIANSRALVERMGRWPSFHDAHLLQVVRTDEGLQVVVHLFAMTDEVDAAGYFVLTKHHLLRLDLLRVTTCTLPADYHGDILNSMTAEVDALGVVVAFQSVIDPSLSWHVVCGEARIREVVACDPEGKVL